MERKAEGAEIKPAAVNINDNQERTIALLVPDHSRGVLDAILNDYTNAPLTAAGNPPKRALPEAIERLRSARLETFWTDDIEALPQEPRDSIWWEVWCWPDDEATIETTVALLDARAADNEHRLYFNEATVIPVYASRATIELILFSTCSIIELRRASDSPSGTEVLSVNSLALLSTGKNHGIEPLASFSATSAAAAQAARMAARLSAQHPDLWPETIRALMIHSAEWTSPMVRAFSAAPGLAASYDIVRKYGYGIPSYNRAAASATNHLALKTQAYIQPYKVPGGRSLNECHYYSLPWPREILEQLNNTEVKLKITLSYFVEPNPGLSSSIDPQRYQSFGLRFDLRRRNETVTRFKKRVNKFERDNPQERTHIDDDGNWILGPKSISAGSLHCDVLTGPAINLLSRDTLCIYPVGGWWQKRSSREICEKTARYALVVTIQTPDTNIDLHTPIKAIIDTQLGIDTPIDITSNPASLDDMLE